MKVFISWSGDRSKYLAECLRSWLPFVCPLLFEMSPAQLSGPLAQFQALEFEKSGIYRVLATLNSALPIERLPQQDLEETFAVWWPTLEVRLKQMPQSGIELVERRSTDAIVDEILTNTREQLRRETLRLEYASVREKRIDEILPAMERLMALFAHAASQFPASEGPNKFAVNPIVALQQVMSGARSLSEEYDATTAKILEPAERPESSSPGAARPKA